jgi:hypothetical protein
MTFRKRRAGKLPKIRVPCQTKVCFGILLIDKKRQISVVCQLSSLLFKIRFYQIKRQRGGLEEEAMDLGLSGKVAMVMAASKGSGKAVGQGTRSRNRHASPFCARQEAALFSLQSEQVG